jgi:tetratricopeptide (TPR) repeat protein/O-antigen ligase
MAARLLDMGVEAGILAILLLSPIPFGSVLPWTQATLEALVAVTAGMCVIRMLATGQLALRVTPLLWPGAAMLLLIGAQLLLPGRSVSPYATWESFRLWLACLTFLLVLGAHLVTAGRVVRLVSALVVWGVALASWGLVNRGLGRELVLWLDKEVYRGRLVSTFVNPNHQALYFAVLLFLALGMLWRPSRRSRASASGRPGAVAMSLRGTGPVARILFGGAAVVLGLALVLTASRGGVAAAIAGLLAVGVLALVGRIQGRVLIGFAASLGLFAGYVAWLGADALLDRLAILAREPFADLRWEIWRATLRIAAQAPILGVGFGAFEDAIIAHRPAGLSEPYFVDHAHNDYLQLLAEGGTTGVFILGWAAAAWLSFVIGRWRDRQDAFVRGLVMGGLGAVTVVALHSAVDFGLRMPANALLVVAVLAVLPAVVTLRTHRAGPRVDLREWRRDLGFRPRLAVGVLTIASVVAAGVILVPAALADWKYRHASQMVSEKRRAQGALTTAELSGAARELRAAARLDPSNPRIQTAWADVAAELGHRVWTYAVTPDGSRLRPDTAGERLAASQELFGVAYTAYGRSLRAQPLVSLTHWRFGWFLSRLETVRRTVGAERLREAVAPGLAGTLGSDESLLPRALHHLQEAVRLDPASPARRLSLVAFALTHRTGIPMARAIVLQEAREAIRLDGRVLPDVVRMLTAQTVEPDLLWQAVPRQTGTFVELATILESQGRASAAAVALEDAVIIATASPDRARALLARSRFLLRHGSHAEALSQARQALALAPLDSEVFAALAEAYEANGLVDEAAAALGSALALGGDGDLRRLNGYRSSLAGLLTRRGDLAGALLLRRLVIQAMPNDAGAHLELARLLEARQDLVEALREYETARALGEGDWGVQRTVASAFLRHGLLREAAGSAEQAVRLNPEYDELHVELGNVYSRIGLPDRAREHYHHVLARQPTHQAASHGLRAVSGLPDPG